jgi:DNA-binding transcriptional MerR regulator
MENHKPNSELPPIPAKPHVLRYWEQEFTQLKPVKRSGNRRYYQHHEVMLIRRIRELLYGQGFTISGARNLLENPSQQESRVDQSAVDVSLLRHEIKEIITLLGA